MAGRRLQNPWKVARGNSPARELRLLDVTASSAGPPPSRDRGTGSAGGAAASERLPLRLPSPGKLVGRRAVSSPLVSSHSRPPNPHPCHHDPHSEGSRGGRSLGPSRHYEAMRSSGTPSLSLAPARRLGTRPARKSALMASGPPGVGKTPTSVCLSSPRGSPSPNPRCLRANASTRHPSDQRR